MAILDLLKGSYTQKLGETYGATWKGKPVVRSVPFSKAPPSDLQTNSLKAFIALNRISSRIARMGFAHTGLSAKNIHNHNAVARFLSPAIKDHIFTPANIVEVIPPGDNLQITAFAFSRNTGILSVGVRFYPFVDLPVGSKIFIIVFNDLGIVQHSFLSDSPNYFSDVHIDYLPERVYYIMAFLSSPKDKSFVLNNFCLMEGVKMRYSLDEQPTGSLWLDGKPIYQRTLSLAIPDNADTTARNLNLNIRDIETLISHEIVIARGTTPNQQMAQFIPSMAASFTDSNCAFFRPYVNQGNNTFSVVYQLGNQMLVDEYKGKPFYCTIRYTKASD